MIISLDTSATTGTSTCADALTLEKIKGCIKEMEGIQPAPFRNLLLSKNMDPDKDWIVFSPDAAKAIGITKDNIPYALKGRVKINSFIDGLDVFLVRASMFEVGEIRGITWPKA